MAVDLIYFLRRTSLYDITDDRNFRLVTSLSSALHSLKLMTCDRGLAEASKILLNIALGRSYYFCLTEGSVPISSGIAARGYCNFYHVPPDAIVIGDVVTKEQFRGKGFATKAIMLLINASIHGGHSGFFIDTQLANIPMIRAIEKLGFALQQRNDSTAEIS